MANLVAGTGAGGGAPHDSAGEAGSGRASRDLVVVGAGFAGLACAKRAAERGLSVLVIDRKSEPDSHIHTTGILVKEAWEAWPVPERLVRRISRVRVYAPSHRYVEFERSGYYFMATDTGALLRHLVARTRKVGVEVRFGEPFRGSGTRWGKPRDGAAGIDNRLDTRGAAAASTDRSGTEGAAAAPFLVGADGARSAVATHFGLDRNTRLLKGVEWEYEPVPAAGNCLHCFVDPGCAPGYIGWVVPGVATTQVGIAVHENRRADLRRFIARIDPLFGLSGRPVLQRRGGLIPIGGALRRTYRDEVMLIGDAAGMVSPLTAGGIHQSYTAGKVAGDAVADYLGRDQKVDANSSGKGARNWLGTKGGPPHPARVLKARHRQPAWKRLARWGYDRVPVAALLEAGVMGHNAFRRVAERVFFDPAAKRAGVVAAVALVAACGSGGQGEAGGGEGVAAGVQSEPLQAQADSPGVNLPLAVQERPSGEVPPSDAEGPAEAAPSMTLLVRGGRMRGELDMSPAFVVNAPPSLPEASGPYEVAGFAADGTELFAHSFDMGRIADGAPDAAGFTFAIPAPYAWAGALERIVLTGPEGSVVLTPDGLPTEYLVLSAETGQVTAIVSGEAGRAHAEAAAAAGAVVLTSRGVPGAEGWRREGR